MDSSRLAAAIRAWADEHPGQWIEHVLAFWALDPYWGPGPRRHVEVLGSHLEGPRDTSAVALVGFCKWYPLEDGPEGAEDLLPCQTEVDLRLTFEGPLSADGPLPPIASICMNAISIAML